MPLMNFTQYAKHRGVTQQAVSYAVAEGRIPVVVNKNTGRRYIDSEVADKEWDANTDYTHQPDRQKVSELRKTKEKVRAKEVDGVSTARPSGIPTITESKAIKEAFLARTAKLEYERLAGKLVNLEDANKEWLRIAGAVKSKMLSIPSKLKQKLPHLTLDDIATIDDEIREALSELADKRGL